MEISKAIEILKYHQEWRLGNKEYMINTPKELTEAIDTLIKEVERAKNPKIKILYSTEVGVSDKVVEFNSLISELKQKNLKIISLSIDIETNFEM